MTLIAIRVEPDQATILTDTLAYSPDQVQLGSCSKVRHFPHLDAAVMTRGPSGLSTLWEADRGAAMHGDFDRWHDEAREHLPDLWEHALTDDRFAGGGEHGWVYQIGWSPSRGRFVGYEYHSEDRFAGTDISDRGVVADVCDIKGLGDPHTDDEWRLYGITAQAELGDPIRRSDSCGIIIGGDLILTRLRRGEMTSRRLHGWTLDDWTFRRMFIGSLHFIGQVGPCPCGAGKPAVLCHLLAAIDPEMPCPCDSGVQFTACHLIDPGDPDVADYLRRYFEDYSRDQAQLAAAWQRPVEQ